MAYTTAAKIGNQLGITIDANSAPNSTDLAQMLIVSDGMINAEVRVTTNMTDTYGELNGIAQDLTLRQVRNYWSFRNPDLFPYETLELTPAQIRIIHRIHLKFSGTTWDPYETGSQV